MVIVFVLAQVKPCGHEAKTQGATLPMCVIPQQVQMLPGPNTEYPGAKMPATTTGKALRAFLGEDRIFNLVNGTHRILESQ
jgi:hypothetical protein